MHWLLLCGRAGQAWPAVDVYEQEPLTDVADPRLLLPNVLATPHIGYVTREDYEFQFAEIFNQIVAYAAGTPINAKTATSRAPAATAASNPSDWVSGPNR